MRARSSLRRGFTLIGMLISLVIMVVLFTVGMTAMNKRWTGQGTVMRNTIRSFEDKLQLASLYQSLAVAALDNKERYPVPGDLTGEVTDNTTASLFSLLIARHSVHPQQLVAANEYSPYVWPDEDYDQTAYDPAAGVYWDPKFVADLDLESNVSFAHIPLFGDRAKRYWRATLRSNVPVLSTRGPKDGLDDPDSWTYGRDGSWAGHLVFGDGHVEYLTTFTPASVFYERNGQRYADNIFAIDDGIDGRDVIMTFTKEMTEDGPVIQHD